MVIAGRSKRRTCNAAAHVPPLRRGDLHERRGMPPLWPSGDHRPRPRRHAAPGWEGTRPLALR
jgi:hypothetical protein